MKRTVCILCASFLLFILAVPMGSMAAEKQPYEITIYTLATGSTTHLFGVALAELINKHSTWLKATAVEGFGPTTNMKLLITKPELRKKAFIFSARGGHWLVEYGKKRGVPAYKDIKEVAAWGMPANSFISLNPNITKFEDFKGKKVGVDMKYFFGRCEVALTVVKQYVPLKEMKIEYLKAMAGFDALRDGLIDVYYAMGVMKSLTEATPSAPTRAFLDTVRKKPYFISPTPEKVKAGMQALGGYPNFTRTVAPMTFHPKQDVPWTLTLGILSWACDAAMPDDVVYEFARINFENHKRFAELHPAGQYISEETIGLIGMSEDKIHPGALKLYKERGVKVGSPEEN